MHNMLEERGALARLLVTLYNNQGVELSTRELLRAIKSTHHGQSTIRKAVALKYVKRTRVAKRSAGQPPLVCRLTPRGEELAERLADLTNPAA